MDSVGHFEIPAKDPKRASAFYTSAFGWEFMKYPGLDYWRAATTATGKDGIPTTPGAINGGLAKKGGALKALTITIVVADIDVALKKVSEFGGKVLVKKEAVAGGMGFTAYFSDTEGNVMGLYQNPRQ
jgi:uncharacterized protein